MLDVAESLQACIAHPRKQHWRLCADHAHILVRLHDLQGWGHVWQVLDMSHGSKKTHLLIAISSSACRQLQCRGSVPCWTHLLYACQRQLVVFEFRRIRADLHRRHKLAV